MVLKRARGTVLVASVTSSARWAAPSKPENMKLGLAMPVRKTTASELQPLLFTKFVQTKWDVRKDGVRAKQVIKITTKEVREKTTRFIVRVHVEYLSIGWAYSRRRGSSLCGVGQKCYVARSRGWWLGRRGRIARHRALNLGCRIYGWLR